MEGNARPINFACVFVFFFFERTRPNDDLRHPATLTQEAYTSNTVKKNSFPRTVHSAHGKRCRGHSKDSKTCFGFSKSEVKGDGRTAKMKGGAVGYHLDTHCLIKSW